MKSQLARNINRLKKYAGTQWQHKLVLLGLVGLLLCLSFISFLRPVEAAIHEENSFLLTSSQLEEKILEIIHNHPQAILDSLKDYQQQQEEQQQQAKELIFRELSINPLKIIGESPRTGTVKNKIILLEFSDFQCSYCAETHKMLKQFMTSHQDEVTLVYKHFPLNGIHPEALAAAKASWAASKQGKFWQYHDALFAQQDKLGEQLYLEIARDLNLDMKRFNQERYGKEADIVIEQDIEMAKTLGIQGTPFFVMDRNILVGAIPLSDLEKALSVSNSIE